MKRYIFHYNGDMENDDKEYHESLLSVDNMYCKADISTAQVHNGKLLVEAYFDDGNDLDVWVDELEEN